MEGKRRIRIEVHLLYSRENYEEATSQIFIEFDAVLPEATSVCYTS
jgi:hypothetical protein